MNEVLEYEGYCPICQSRTTYRAVNPAYRASLVCQKCPGGSVPRERALALILEERFPDWRNLAIHESSPGPRGISAKLLREAKNLIQSQFFSGVPLGQMHKGFRNEDLHKMTFRDEQFDLFISLDVMEHVMEPDAVFKEIARTLKRGGHLLCTWPVRRDQVVAMERRAVLKSDGSIEHVRPASYHGNPIDSSGSLVTVDYGYEVHKQIAAASGMDVRVYRFCDRENGILGDFTEVFLARRRA